MATRPDVAALVLRVALAVMLFPHGMQKTVGWFGGYGFSATLDFFGSSLGIPAPLAFLAILTEALAPLALLLGLFGRVAALATTVLMVVAATFHLENGFLMNWSGAQAGEGVEFHLLAIAAAVAVAIRGSGLWSVDAAWSRSMRAPRPLDA